MRLLVVWVLGVSLAACSLDVGDDFYFEKVPARNVQVPENASLNTDYNLQFDYHLPDGCYTFYNIDYTVVNDTTRIITPYARVQNGVNCTQDTVDSSFTFQFTPSVPKTYVFKFWVGTDDEGNDVFETHELETD